MVDKRQNYDFSKELLLRLIKIKQIEIDKLEMLRMYNNSENKEEKIKKQKVIIDWLNQLINRTANPPV